MKFTLEINGCKSCPYGTITFERDARYDLDTGKTCECVNCRKIGRVIYIEDAEEMCPLCKSGEVKKMRNIDLTDTVIYFEMARFVMGLPDGSGLKAYLDISDGEFDRLRAQLEKILEEE